MTLLLHKQNAQRDYLVTDKTWELMIEYTTGCNLRCSYCAVSQPGWNSRDLDKDLSANISRQVIQRKPEIVTIHGHGETTIIPGWEDEADKFIRAGLKTTICTNLCKLFTEQELEVLASLDHLTVSIDTIDVKLFKQLRRGGDVRHLVYNYTRIRNISKRLDNDLTTSWSIVCSDQSIWGLIDLIEYGIYLGVDGFTLCNLGATDAPDGMLQANHVSELSVDDSKRALTILNELEQICKVNNRHIDIKSGILDTLKLKIVSGSTNWNYKGNV